MRDLKGRIGSVASSEKITGAMKMISSAKMHKAESALRRVRPFRDQIQNTIDHLISADAEYSSPLTEIRPVKRRAIVLLSSDEGLCGAFNMNLFKRTLEIINQARMGCGQCVPKIQSCLLFIRLERKPLNSLKNLWEIMSRLLLPMR